MVLLELLQAAAGHGHILVVTAQAEQIVAGADFNGLADVPLVVDVGDFESAVAELADQDRFAFLHDVSLQRHVQYVPEWVKK